MNRSQLAPFQKLALPCGLLLLAFASGPVHAQPPPGAIAAFNVYVSEVESRLARQRRLPGTFVSGLEGSSAVAIRLRAGELILEDLTAPAGAELPGALLHHWRGTVFVASAKAADFEQLLRAVNAYPIHFSPQVLEARLLGQKDGHLLVWMRVGQKHILPVVMDATYDVSFGRLDSQCRYSTSRSIQISEIDSPGKPGEHALSSQQEHGFLWRSNSYWTYQQQDDGLYLQIETVSLSRSIPSGLAWAIRPFVQSIPREALEFTLGAAADAVRK